MALSKQVLEMLLEETARVLLDRISSGEASPADINNALRMLRDNDISIVLQDSDALQALNERLSRKKHPPVTLDDALEYTRKDALN
jgi:hypothetical protein